MRTLTLIFVIVAAGCGGSLPNNPASAPDQATVAVPTATEIVNTNVGRWERHFQTKPMWKEYYDLRADGTFEYFNEPEHTASGKWFMSKGEVVLYLYEENGRSISPAAEVELTKGPEENMLTVERWRHYCKQAHPHEAVAARASAPSQAVPGGTTNYVAPTSDAVKFRYEINAQADRATVDPALAGAGISEFSYDDTSGLYLVTHSGELEKVQAAVAAYMRRHGVDYDGLKKADKIIFFGECDF